MDESQAVIEVLNQGSLEALPAFGSLLLPVFGSLPNSTFRLKTGYMSLPLRTLGGFMAEIVLDPDFELPGLGSRWVLWERPGWVGRQVYSCLEAASSDYPALSHSYTRGREPDPRGVYRPSGYSQQSDFRLLLPRFDSPII